MSDNIDTNLIKIESEPIKIESEPIKIELELIIIAINNLIMSIINGISNRYGLDEKEVSDHFSNLHYLYLSNTKDMNNNKEKKSTTKEKKEKKYLIPWCPQHVDTTNKCNALVFNNGLLTQCQRNISNKDKENGQTFCNICKAQPDNSYKKHGLVSDRLQKGIYDYSTPYGIKPDPYLNHISPNVNETEIKDYLKTQGYSQVPQEHFSTPRTIFKNQRNKKVPIYVEQLNTSPTISRDISPLCNNKNTNYRNINPIFTPPELSDDSKEIIKTKSVKRNPNTVKAKPTAST